MEKYTYTFFFAGENRYVAMKVLERRFRQRFDTYGFRMVKDTKDCTEVSIDLRESSWYYVNYVFSTLNNKWQTFSDPDTVWVMSIEGRERVW